MLLITAEQRLALIENGRRSKSVDDFDPEPVVKLFTPDANAIWLLSALDPNDPDLAFGLCDLGVGCPELGDVRISEIMKIRGGLGLPVERDLFFRASKTLSQYADEARENGAILA